MDELSNFIRVSQTEPSVELAGLHTRYCDWQKWLGGLRTWDWVIFCQGGLSVFAAWPTTRICLRGVHPRATCGARRRRTVQRSGQETRRARPAGGRLRHRRRDHGIRLEQRGLMPGISTRAGHVLTRGLPLSRIQRFAKSLASAWRLDILGKGRLAVISHVDLRRLIYAGIRPRCSAECPWSRRRWRSRRRAGRARRFLEPDRCTVRRRRAARSRPAVVRLEDNRVVGQAANHAQTTCKKKYPVPCSASAEQFLPITINGSAGRPARHWFGLRNSL